MVKMINHGCFLKEKVFMTVISYCEAFSLFVVRLIGLEPTRLTAPDPKSGAATNYATSACVAFLFSGAKIGRFSDLTNYSVIKLLT